MTFGCWAASVCSEGSGVGAGEGGVGWASFGGAAGDGCDTPISAVGFGGSSFSSVGLGFASLRGAKTIISMLP